MFRLRSGLPLLAGAALVALVPAMSDHEAGAQVTPPSADVLFKSPSGISVHNDGTVFVADTGNHRIQVFDRNGTFLFAFGSEGSGEGNFSSPRGVDVTKSSPMSRSKIAVADTGNHRIQVFHANGTFDFAFGSEGSGEGNFSSPGGVATRRVGGGIAVADTGNHRIQVFHANGAFNFAFGSEGSGNGNFSSPGGVGMTRHERFYVADTGNHRIQLFGYDGEFDRVIGSHGTGVGQFDGPQSVNRGWTATAVADTGNHRASFARETRSVGSEGSGEGQLLSPEGAAMGAYYRTYVADTGNHRIQVFHYNGTFAFSFGSEGSVGVSPFDPDAPPPAGNGTGVQPAPPPDAPPPAGNGTGVQPAPPPDAPPVFYTCSVTLGMPNLDVRAQPGEYSDPIRQVVANSGNLSFARIDLAATPWRAAAGSVVVLPASATEWSAAGPGGGYAAFVDGAAVVAHGLVGGDEVPLWFRLNMVSHGDLRASGAIVQHVAYSAECNMPP